MLYTARSARPVVRQSTSLSGSGAPHTDNFDLTQGACLNNRDVGAMLRHFAVAARLVVGRVQYVPGSISKSSYPDPFSTSHCVSIERRLHKITNDDASH
jgi:hypothetical protein